MGREVLENSDVAIPLLGDGLLNDGCSEWLMHWDGMK